MSDERPEEFEETDEFDEDDQGILQKMVSEKVDAELSAREATTGKIINKTIIAANTEYEIKLPPNTKRLNIQCRDGTVFIFALEKGNVEGATPPREYRTVLANGSYAENGLNLERASIFVAGTAGKIIEVLAWR